MGKNVLIITGSPRKDGNSDLLAKEFAKGALEQGNNVDFIRIADKNLGYCKACYVCSTLGVCVQKDEMNDIAQKLISADVVLFASPVYFYSMSGQLKVFMDRLVPFYEKVKADIYIFVTAADNNEDLIKNAVNSIRGTTRDCFENCSEKGVIMAGNVNDKGDILNSPLLKKAYLMGLHC